MLGGLDTLNSNDGEIYIFIYVCTYAGIQIGRYPTSLILHVLRRKRSGRKQTLEKLYLEL